MILGKVTLTGVIKILVITFMVLFSSFSCGQQKQIVVNNAEAAAATGAGSRAVGVEAGGEKDVNVLYAGSMLSVMETKIGPAFSSNKFGYYNYRGEGHGSIQNANMMIDGQRSPDVFISVGTNPMNMLFNKKPMPLARWYLGFASDEMVIAYNPTSPFAADFEKAKSGIIPWYQVLAKPGMRFLRTDPLLDPKGCYTIIDIKLASILYHNSSIVSTILKGQEREEDNDGKLRPEEILLTLLEQGEADAVPAYKHEAIERGFPFINLPPQINLGNPDFANYYKQAACRQHQQQQQKETGSLTFGTPIVFYITIPTTVKNIMGAVQFVKFILSKEGRTILQNDGFKIISPPLIHGDNVSSSSIPKEILSHNN
jgi:molybdate/tungstate transport system substrate-binding protein